MESDELTPPPLPYTPKDIAHATLDGPRTIVYCEKCGIGRAFAGGGPRNPERTAIDKFNAYDWVRMHNETTHPRRWAHRWDAR